MPLSDVGRRVARPLEHLGESDFALKQVRTLGFIVNPAVNPGADMMAARQQGRA